MVFHVLFLYHRFSIYAFKDSYGDDIERTALLLDKTGTYDKNARQNVTLWIRFSDTVKGFKNDLEPSILLRPCKIYIYKYHIIMLSS